MAKDIQFVRLVARLLAFGLAGAGMLAAYLVREPSIVGRAPPTLAISAVLIESPQPRPVERDADLTPLGAPADVALGATAPSAPVRLWTYSLEGEIVFETVEQFQRCLEARRRASNEADCPSASETRGLALRDAPRLVLDKSASAKSGRPVLAKAAR